MTSTVRALSLAGLLAPALLSGCMAPAPDGNIGVADEKIVSGANATTDQIFSTVGIAPGMSICTGSVIAPQVILTAAHCVANDDGSPSVTPAQTTVYAGALQVDMATADQTFTVRKIVSHELYRGITNIPAPDANGLSKAYDIAILLLDKPITTLPVVPILPVSMIDGNLMDGTMLTITGYGNSDAASTMGSGTLRIAQTPSKAHNETESFAGAAGSPDTCQGDSGGPQYIDIGGTKYQVGETSRGGGSSACGDGGIYTLAGAYIDWINTNSEGLYAGTSSATGAGATTGSGTSSGAGGGGGSGDSGSSGGCATASSSSDALAPFALVAAALVVARRRRRR